MKKAILNEEEWFTNALEMCGWLEEHFKDDSTKFYSHLDSEINAKKREGGWKVDGGHQG